MRQRGGGSKGVVIGRERRRENGLERVERRIGGRVKQEQQMCVRKRCVILERERNEKRRAWLSVS